MSEPLFLSQAILVDNIYRPRNGRGYPLHKDKSYMITYLQPELLFEVHEVKREKEST